MSRSDVPIGASATPDQRTDPLMLISFVPAARSLPTAAKASAPSTMMNGTFARVSALFTTVGLAQRPASVG